MEREPPRPTDDDLIEQGIEAWHDRGIEGLVDDTTARIIASQYHDGQGSYLYSFASTGAINLAGLSTEVFGSYRVSNDKKDEWGQRLLDTLAEYLLVTGDHEPVEGWHESTTW